MFGGNAIQWRTCRGSDRAERHDGGSAEKPEEDRRKIAAYRGRLRAFFARCQRV